MIRCIKMWTDPSVGSIFEEGSLALPDGHDGDAIGKSIAASAVSFRETRPEDALAWHVAPTRQFVLTLAGTLEFETREGKTFVIRPGDVLLAEDITGGGHRWRVVGDEPWRRAYVVLAPGVEPAFAPFRTARRARESRR